MRRDEKRITTSDKSILLNRNRLAQQETMRNKSKNFFSLFHFGHVIEFVSRLGPRVGLEPAVRGCWNAQTAGNPISGRYSGAVSGIAEGVGGASDRAFYQTMVEDYPEVADKDLGFVACGGKGSSKHVAHITSHVGLRCAFVYDFDALLTDVGTIQDICATLGGDISQLDELGTIIAQFGSTDQARKSHDIKEAATAGIESSMVQHNHEAFDKAIRALNSVGIFFVPYGTLESWAPDVEPKVRFSDKAPDVIRSNPSLKARFDQFIQPILRYLGC